MKVSREYVEEILALTNLSAEEKKRIRDLTYPADHDEVLALFASMGVTPDRLTSRMGGSP